MKTDDYTAWLASLKAGDEVAIVPASSAQPTRIATVERRTPTGTLRARGYLFRRGVHHNGIHTYRLQTVTQDMRDQRERVELATKFQHVIRWGAVPLELLREVAATIAKRKPPEQPIRGPRGGYDNGEH